MPLLDLPPEVMDLIIRALSSEADINALAQTNRGFHALLNHYLYSVNIHNGGSGLVWATRKRQIRAIQKFRSSGDIDEIHTSYTFEAFLLLIEDNDLATVQVLVDLGFVPDIPDLLSLAVTLGHEDMVRLLIASGTNPTCPYALAEAVTSDRVSIATFLLESGADGHHRHYDDGVTLLHVAAQAGYETMVRLLLDHGACPRGRNHRQETPIHLAMAEGHAGVVKILHEEVMTTEPRDSDGRTFLHVAALAGSVDMVKYLLHHRADPEALTNQLETPLMLASQGGCTEVVKLLLNKGVLTELSDHGGWRALHHAARGGHDDVLRVLLEHGVNKQPLSTSTPPETPLQQAALEGHLGVVTLMLEYGVEVDPDALETANVKGHQAVVEVLENWGR
ncbi:hypothetical protein N7510_005670 [Penicillium lagena]|uniref:uncharacterized protein n=1 Tax=Penicillium lagena TaxID=94218 RepID=UPI0025407520|nr:uncharacterized protein N7510_005670 [Penicillium lagena]KAJ5612476.1 hypothetical protein N7510_005670 [Penicillium lagena]